jgi:hypothetical protein
MPTHEFNPYYKAYKKDIKPILEQAKSEIPARNDSKSHHHICPDYLISKLNFPDSNGPFGICYIIENKPRGIIIHLIFNEFVYLKIVAVHPSERNKHIGSSLVDKLISQFNNHCILTQTFSSNIPMKKIFSKYNFVEVYKKIDDRKNGDASEWYGLNFKNHNLINKLISVNFDLIYS